MSTKRWRSSSLEWRLIFQAIDWDEFHEVLRGNGPCNDQRINQRRRAHEEGAWVREAAAAYAGKHTDAHREARA